MFVILLDIKVQEVDMREEKHKVGVEKEPESKKESSASDWLFLRRPPAFLDPLRKLFEPPKRLIEPYVKKGQVVADLGCGSGYYTLPLADLVGPEGKVCAVDLGKKSVRTLEKKADKGG